MKKTSLSMILVLSLLGAPAPVQAANGMADMMSLMMEMFLWMMSGGGGGFNRYNNAGSFGGLGNPMLANSMLGYPGGLGSGLPYSSLGMFSSPAFSGFSPYTNPYTSPSIDPYSSQYGSAYDSTYYRDNYGAQPYYRQDYNNPYTPNYYGLNLPYGRPYRPDPYRRHDVYGKYGPHTQASGQKAPVVIQPIIVSPAQHASSDQAGVADTMADISVEALPPVYSPQAPAEPEFSAYGYDDRPGDYANPLYGRWQGINGEFMELGKDRFRMRSNGTELLGIYQVKNSILKVEISDRSEPVYMQYRLDDGHLMFLSENGQKMLFRRLP